MKSSLCLLLAAAACTSSSPSTTMTDAELQRVVAQRYAGDRTATCIAAAVIDDGVHRAQLCADPAHPRVLDADDAFEIGSVSKTMTAALLADLIDQGKLALTDPIARYLPAETSVPTFQGTPILISHLVTHTSGLPTVPSGLAGGQPDNPYAALTDDALLASLADVTLAQAPGASWAYSNFGGMLLSYIVTRVAGHDFETTARDRLFGPLGMAHAYVAHPPAGTRALVGHRSTGEATGAWDFAPDLAGVGGVRATLDDMIAYAQAQLGRGDARTVAVLARTHAAVDLGMPRAAGVPDMAMAWIRASLDGRAVLVHDGGTGGFSSFVAIDPEADRAIVLLADTELGNVGGLNDLALHLLDPTAALPGPRTVVASDPTLISALVGHYEVADFEVELIDRDGALVAVLPDGSNLAFELDSHGDFFTHDVDIILTPTRAADGSQTFALIQGGAPVIATRLAP